MFMGDGIGSIAYAHDDGSFAINVRTTGTDRDNRRVYDYSVFVNGALLTSGDDLHSGVGDDPNARTALGTLIAFLGADADKYRRLMGRPVPDHDDDGYVFGDAVAEWAYGVSEELEMIALESDD